jgi:hypothetical protein
VHTSAGVPDTAAQHALGPYTARTPCNLGATLRPSTSMAVGVILLVYYCAMLCCRVFGDNMAEMPFVATRQGFRRAGHCRRLIKVRTRCCLLSTAPALTERTRVFEQRL